jgi:hypothetical protein
VTRAISTPLVFLVAAFFAVGAQAQSSDTTPRASVTGGLTFIGSMPHVAAEGGWSTTFTLVNKSSISGTAQLNQFAFDGSALALPVTLPQQTSSGTLITSSITQAMAPNSSFIMQDIDVSSASLAEGSAQLAASGTVDGFAIFHFDPTEQEAVVPMETRNAPSYLLAFDNTSNVVTGVALGNVAGSAAAIPMTIRDDKGAIVTTGTINLAANGHTSFVLPTLFAQTANIRGTVEFDTPSGGQIAALGIRYTPPGTTTTIPVLANVGTTGGLMAHLAVGNGWQTTFVLVNTGASSAQANLAFFDKSGNPLPLPLSFPQSSSGTTTTESTYGQAIPANASLWVESTAPLGAAYQEGSAQLTTNGNVSGFVIFRFNPNGQEAVVPLESRNAGGYLIAYDNTNGTLTGIAINVLSAFANEIPIILRDDQGNVLGGGGFDLLGANGHDSFVLSTRFPQTANLRGTIEFDAPPGAPISVLGIRTPPPLTFTTLPPLVTAPSSTFP